MSHKSFVTAQFIEKNLNEDNDKVSTFEATYNDYCEENENDTSKVSVEAYDFVIRFREEIYSKIQDFTLAQKYYHAIMKFIKSHIERGMLEGVKQVYKVQDKKYLDSVDVKTKETILKNSIEVLKQKINKSMLKYNTTYESFASLFLRRHSDPAGISIDAMLRTNIKAVAKKAIVAYFSSAQIKIFSNVD